MDYLQRKNINLPKFGTDRVASNVQFYQPLPLVLLRLHDLFLIFCDVLYPPQKLHLSPTKWNFAVDCWFEEKTKIKFLRHPATAAWYERQRLRTPHPYLLYSNRYKKCWRCNFRTILELECFELERLSSPTIFAYQSLMFGMSGIHNDQKRAVISKWVPWIRQNVAQLRTFDRFVPTDRSTFCAINVHNLECDMESLKCVYHLNTLGNSTVIYFRRTEN